MVWMCVPVSLHTSTHTYANKYIHTNNINLFEWLYFRYKISDRTAETTDRITHTYTNRVSETVWRLSDWWLYILYTNSHVLFIRLCSSQTHTHTLTLWFAICHRSSEIMCCHLSFSLISRDFMSSRKKSFHPNRMKCAWDFFFLSFFDVYNMIFMVFVHCLLLWLCLFISMSAFVRCAHYITHYIDAWVFIWRPHHHSFRFNSIWFNIFVYFLAQNVHSSMRVLSSTTNNWAHPKSFKFFRFGQNVVRATFWIWNFLFQFTEFTKSWKWPMAHQALGWILSVLLTTFGIRHVKPSG